MVPHKAVNWATENRSKGVFEVRYYFNELLTIIICYTANKRQGQILATIRINMQMNEISEVLANKSLNGGIAEVGMYKLRKARKKTICKWLTIYSINNLGKREACLIFKVSPQFF